MVVELPIQQVTALISRDAFSTVTGDDYCYYVTLDGDRLTAGLQQGLDEFAIRPTQLADNSDLPDFEEWCEFSEKHQDLRPLQDAVHDEFKEHGFEVTAAKGFDSDKEKVVTVKIIDEVA